MTAPRDASFDDYLVKSMKDPAEAAAYIEAMMELDDPAALLVARRADVGDKPLNPPSPPTP